MLTDAVQQDQHAPIRHVIEDIVALSLRRQYALILEDAKLLADDGLGRTRRLGDLGDRAGAALLAQEVQDAQPDRVRGIADDRRDPLQRLHVDQ